MSERLLYYGELIPDMNFADLHMHTNRSDGSMKPDELVERAVEAGMRMVGVTDHGTIRGSWDAKTHAAKMGYEALLDVPLCAEIETDKGDVLAIGVESDIKEKQPLGDTLEKIHDQGGVSIIAHPGLRLAKAVKLREARDAMHDPNPRRRPHAVEVFNATGDEARRIPILGRIIFEPNANLAARDFIVEHERHPNRPAAVAGTDGHMREVGRAVTGFIGDDIKQAIIDRQTAVFYVFDQRRIAPVRSAFVQGYRGYLSGPMIRRRFGLPMAREQVYG